MRGPFGPQVLENLDAPVSMNGSLHHTWWVTLDQLNPATFEIPEGKEENPGPGFRPANVPQNLAEIFKDLGRNQLEAWYVKTIVIPAGTTRPLAFLLGIINDKDRAYLNGTPIGASGNFDVPGAQAYDLRRIYEIPPGALKPGLNVLMVHVRGQSTTTWGLYQHTTAIGPARMILEEESSAALQSILFLVCYSTVACYFLFVFGWQMERRENLFFALFCLGLVSYNLLRNQIKYALGLDFLFWKRIEYIVLYSLVPLFYWFIRSYYSPPRTKITKLLDIPVAAAHLLLAFGVVHCFLTQDSDDWWHYQLLFAQQISWPILIPLAMAIILQSAFRGSRDAWLMFTAVLVLVLGMVTDILSNRGVWNLPALFQYIFMLFIIAMALLLANRFVRLHDESEDLNANLEKKIEERTAELRTSVAEAEAIKSQQDGDYFLTSLLIQPLSGIFSDGGPVHAEVLTRQKKTFQFRHWRSDLGGDLSIVDRITLQGKPYTVFINADAMGKSMQGAGGSLVLGTVFQSMLSYNRRRKDNRAPEIWLRDCFSDLQSVFTAFDGSMLTSAVFGMIAEDSGVLYFVNAEHPGVVLYRDQTATFLQLDTDLRKLGVSGTEENLRVYVHQLLPEDVIFAGTDGRDDLHTGDAADGTRTINDDPAFFLRCVEKAPHNLPSLYEEITHHGYLIDDLGLIRLGYLEDAPASARPVPVPAGAAGLLSQGKAAFAARNAEGALGTLTAAFEQGAGDQALELALRCALQLKRAKESLNLAEQIHRYPANTRLLYLGMRAWRRAGMQARAMEAGERFVLRSPLHAKGLVHLADLYRLTGDAGRARALADQAMRRAPGFEIARRLKEILAAACMALLPLFTSSVQAQAIDAEQLTRIESGKDFAWQVTSDSLDPAAETEAFFGGKNTSDSTVSWNAARVPGELRSSSREIWLKLPLFIKPGARSLALRLGVIRDRDRVYWNGELIGSSGQWDAELPQAYDRRRLYEVPAEKVRAKNLLLIQIQSYGTSPPALRLGPLSAGPLTESSRRDTARAYVQAMLAIIILSISAYFLFLYIRRKRQTDYLYFGLFALMLAVFVFLQGDLKYSIWSSFVGWKRLEYIAQYLAAPLYYAFVREFLPERRAPSRRALTIAAFAALGGLALASLHILISSNVQLWTDVRTWFVYPVCFGLLGLLGAHHIFTRFRSGETEAFVLSGILVLYGSGVALQQFIKWGFLQTGSLLDFFNLGIVAASGTLLTTRFMLLNRQVEVMRRDLEDRVRVRTEELSAVLSRVRTLREAQDADYFLTTLLLGPLQRNSLVHPRIQSSILVKQKKSFDFRKWRAEIGGDLCITDVIRLAGREYAVFINGDAMGKSLQGAGGAIVLGTVFHAAVSRSEKSAVSSQPEEWLRECYEELQNVFVTFDGSMLVSVAAGLIDLESRVLYHFNAEHPGTVLYRNGRAAFLGQSHLMKIGIRGQEEHFQVLQETLLPGDVIIAGSDGRDDLWIGSEADGSRIINADETLFLRVVEKTTGDLTLIQRELEAIGQITDDLSLIRLEV